MKNIIRRFQDKIKPWRIYIGKDPRCVPNASITIFPVLSEMLCCGLAGIMTIKRPVEKEHSNPCETLAVHYEAVAAHGIDALMQGKITADKYLDSKHCLEEMEEAVHLLKKDENHNGLFFHPQRYDRLAELLSRMKAFLEDQERTLDVNAGRFSTTELELVSGRLIMLKDIIWALDRDVLAGRQQIMSLAGISDAGSITPWDLKKYREINYLLNCVDRLEVRGRDSAGIQVMFTIENGSALDAIMKELKEAGLHDDFARRCRPGDLANGSISIYSGNVNPASAPSAQGSLATLSFTYKTFSVIGELGRNVKELRKSIEADAVFRLFAGSRDVFLASLAHTRWASVGSITEENCHPINSHTVKNNSGKNGCSISVVLNGDIDNYQSLREKLEAGDEMIAPELTTDTKIIPLQIRKYLSEGKALVEAFRLAVNDFEGSHAISMVSDLEPGKVFLALKGSGQTIYIGLAGDKYIISSELYGLVEATPWFIQMDGEKPSQADGSGRAGQIFILDQDSEGWLSGIDAFYYDKTKISLDRSNIRKAEITTRDIDRSTYPHFFLKEINESTLSVKKTLRGKYRVTPGEDGGKKVVFNLGEDIVPLKIRLGLTEGSLRRAVIIGHGTAAVAGCAVADSFERYLKGASLKAEAKIASELSGFFMEDDLHDTLIIAITQSGTTTDTNRAVAMAAERGASVIAIVNRRQSDITGKSDGVFYTSDGRDIEMSVASTKAFYSQIIAGHVLALYFARHLGTMSDDAIAEELSNLENIPALMAGVLEKRDLIKKSVESLAKKKKYWAVVGSGPNKVAADEIRIKLSELCYKTISSDVIENKKHIDLSAEPLIIACAAGNPETVAGDIAKDVAIFKAHKAGVVVFADEGDHRFDSIADTVIEIPKAPLPAPVILNTLAGHLWGYYAACSIDDDALYIREFRSRFDLKMVEQIRKRYNIYERIADKQLRRILIDFSSRFNEMRNSGAFLFTNVKTVSDIVLLLKYSAGKLPLEDFWQDFKVRDDIASPLTLLDISLGNLIDELSRPVDAIRHQAKTVTVGTSRKEQILQGTLFELLKDLGFTAKNLVSRSIPAITRIQPAIASVEGYTLYEINNLEHDGSLTEGTTIAIKARAGRSLTMHSRTEGAGVLMGTKKTIVRTRNIYVGQGKSDGASIVIIPVLNNGTNIGNLLLVHVSFNENLPVAAKRSILGNRYNDIRNLINEYNLAWDDRYLETIPLQNLLGEQVEIIARLIRNNIEKKRD